MDSDLKLDQARPHFSDQLQFFLIEDVRRDFKMKICNPVVMFHQITPDS